MPYVKPPSVKYNFFRRLYYTLQQVWINRFDSSLRLERKMKKPVNDVLHLEPTEQNRALVREYQALTKEINISPAVVAGLAYGTPKNYRAQRMMQILDEREKKLMRLLEIEKILGFPPR